MVNSCQCLIVAVGWEESQNVSGADSNFYEGWKVHIHDPSEFPEVSRKGFLVGTGQEVAVR